MRVATAGVRGFGGRTRYSLVDGNQQQMATLINNSSAAGLLRPPIDEIVRVSFTLFD